MYLELGEGVRVVSKAEGVEGATGVQGVQALNAWALAVCAVCLSTAHEDHLQPSTQFSHCSADAQKLLQEDNRHAKDLKTAVQLDKQEMLQRQDRQAEALNRLLQRPEKAGACSPSQNLGLVKRWSEKKGKQAGWEGRRGYLAGQGGDDGLGVHQGGVAQVVEAVRAEDLSAGLEPDGLAEGDAVLGEQLWGHAAQGSEHGPASVDDLDLAVAAE